MVQYQISHDTKFHTTTRMTPFKALYGYPPSMPNITFQGDSLVQVVGYTIKTREQIAKILHRNLQKAQNKMKLYADQKPIYKEFYVRDLIY